MATKTFTDEEIIELSNNPYVQKVSPTTITYTQEFREFFVSEYQKGIAPNEILRRAGFNRKILGKERCDSISRNLRKRATREDGLADKRKLGGGRQRFRELSPEEEIQRLRQKVKYLEQENMFLKKINFLEAKALHTHNQKKNSKSSMKCSKKTTMS
jgi:transposase-like protein